MEETANSTEEKRLVIQCLGLCQFLANQRRCYSLKLKLTTGFQFESDFKTVKLGNPFPQPPPFLMEVRGAVEPHSSKWKNKNPSKVRRDALRLNLYRKRREENSPAPEPLSPPPSPGEAHHTAPPVVEATNPEQLLDSQQPTGIFHTCSYLNCAFERGSSHGLSVHVGKTHKREVLRVRPASSGDVPGVLDLDLGEDREMREESDESREV